MIKGRRGAVVSTNAAGGCTNINGGAIIDHGTPRELGLAAVEK
jgi:hypothetical protein